MNTVRCLALGLFVFSASCASFGSSKAPKNDFAFLKGTWAQTTAKETTEEVWTSETGWILHGVGRTLRNGREVSRETLAIEPRGPTYVYVASLPGAEPVEFALVDRGIDWARFENRAHDFPQRIEYHRDGNTLRAEVSGVEKGRTQREVYDYRRVNAR